MEEILFTKEAVILLGTAFAIVGAFAVVSALVERLWRQSYRRKRAYREK
jgi:uncharacterized membrane protein HdeD (DUF308 family)